MPKLTQISWGEYSRECLKYGVPGDGKIGQYVKQLEKSKRESEAYIEKQRRMLVRTNGFLIKRKEV